MNKKNISIILSLLLVFVFTAAGYAQESTVDKAEVPLTDPSKPALLKASVVNGSISVTGYSGKTILVEARPAPEQSKEDQEADEEDDEADKKSKGMFRIKTTGTGLSIVEENNVAVVKVPFNSQRINLTLKVPYKTNLKVKSVHGGNVEVKKVDGDLAVSNTSGDVTLTNVGGTVVAQTTSGDVSVTFDRINLDKPMSFATFHGDVDVTFPSNAKFNLKMKTDGGEIYSDFQLKTQTVPAKVAETPKKEKGKFKIKFDKSIYALLNGGGEEVQFKTYNGNIYIRKKK